LVEYHHWTVLGQENPVEVPEHDFEALVDGYREIDRAGVGLRVGLEVGLGIES
jgi:hypothetical protein